jgi:hypothetical protein
MIFKSTKTDLVAYAVAAGIISVSGNWIEEYEKSRVTTAFRLVVYLRTGPTFCSVIPLHTFLL